MAIFIKRIRRPGAAVSRNALSCAMVFAKSIPGGGGGRLS